ncbi:MAG: universal stress protein [Chloroflexota bacterium]
MRIVLGVDGSEPSRVALRLLSATEWPRPLDVTLVAAHERPIDWTGTLPIVFNEADEQQVRNELRRMLGDAAAGLRRLGATVSLEVHLGRPADVLLEVARRRSADLLVVGSRGLGAARSALLGSVSAHLVDHAPCPVLVARRPTVDRLLFATDGSGTAVRAATILEGWAAFRGVPIDVVSVAPSAHRLATAFISPWSLSGDVRELPDEDPGWEHRAHAERMVAHLGGAGYRCTAVVRSGDAAREICATAAELGDDLIVTGSRGLGELRRMLAGSIAHGVLLHAGASVLVMRGPVRERHRAQERVEVAIPA